MKIELKKLKIMDNSLKIKDPKLFSIIKEEASRQQNTLEMIASENFTSSAVMEAAGSVLTNKYAEGYPGKRYYGGCDAVDKAERKAAAKRRREAIVRARKLIEEAKARALARKRREAAQQKRLLNAVKRVAQSTTKRGQRFQISDLGKRWTKLGFHFCHCHYRR